MMPQNRVVTAAVLLLVCVGGPVTAAKHDHDKRPPEPPCSPPPCPVQKADTNFEIRVTSIDASASALPVIETVLTSTSNRGDQLSGLQAQAKQGLPILQISYGPTIRVPQDGVGSRENQADVRAEVRTVFPRTAGLWATCSRISVHPHLDANCAEAVDILLEQGSAVQTNGANASEGVVVDGSFVFDNGDTRLLSCTRRPNGTYHLLYATVFFPPPQCLVLK